MIMDECISDLVSIRELEIPQNAVVTLLGEDGSLNWRQEGKDLVVEVPERRTKQYAYTLKIEG